MAFHRSNEPVARFLDCGRLMDAEIQQSLVSAQEKAAQPPPYNPAQDHPLHATVLRKQQLWAKEVLSVVSQSPLLLKTATWRGQFFRAKRRKNFFEPPFPFLFFFLLS